jgi:hypothetical protein
MSVASASADDDDDADSRPKPPTRPAVRWSPYFARMFELKQPAPAKKPAKAQKEDVKKPAAPPRPKAVIPSPTAQRAREEATLLRRLAVCDKLKEIAVRTNDTQLLHQAEQLDARAWANYSQRTGQLAAATVPEADEKALEPPAGPRTVGVLSRRGAPARRVPAAEDGSRAAAKEVSP